jgi:two-component system, cell cycle response regulator DivK
MASSFKHKETAAPIILVVDDTEGVRRIIMMQLKTLGYGVVGAQSGLEAVEIIKRRPPALVLMDINMPEVDGLEATRMIRSTPGISRIPIIGLSAHHGAEIRQTALAAGCDDFVTKPIEFKFLGNLIDQHLKLDLGKV